MKTHPYTQMKLKIDLLKSLYVFFYFVILVLVNGYVVDLSSLQI